MTTFDTRFAARGFPRLLTMFGESIVYHPRVGLPRTMTAIVDREVPQALAEMEGSVAPQLVIEVLNDEQDGIASHLFSRGDQIEVALRVGQTPERRTLTELLDSDAGLCRIGVR